MRCREYMSVFFSIGAGSLLVGAAGATAAVVHYAPKATSAVGLMVDDLETRMRDKTFRLSSYINSKRKSWRRFLGKDAVDLHQEEWAITTQAAICYSQTMTANSGFLDTKRSRHTGFVVPLCYTPELAHRDTFIKTRDCINALIAKMWVSEK